MRQLFHSPNVGSGLLMVQVSNTDANYLSIGVMLLQIHNCLFIYAISPVPITIQLKQGKLPYMNREEAALHSNIGDII